MLTAAELEAAAETAGLTDAAIILTSLGEVGASVAAGSDGQLYPASMIKTPLAVAVALAETAGRLRWTDRREVTPPDLTANDAPSPLALGATATIGELVALMLDRSDNIATNVLIETVGRAKATADLVALGFARTAIRRKLSGSLPLIADPQATGRNTHPAAEAAELFVRLARNTLPRAAEIRAALAAQYWNAKLSRGLLAGDSFAHKTGDTDDVSHDGGILALVDGRRYVLVVYTALPSDDKSDAKFAAFMHAVRPRL